MLLDDAFGVGGGYVLVPGSLRVDEGDGAGDADAEAVALGAVGGAVGTGEVELFHALLDVVPGLFADVGSAAVGAGAEEEVAAEFSDAEIRGHGLGREVLGVGHCR